MKYFTFMLLPIKRQAVYWPSIVLGGLVSVLICLFYFQFWKAVFNNTAEIAGYNLYQAIGYSFLAQMVNSFMSNGVDRNLSRAIQRGTILNQLIRPIGVLDESIITAYGSSFSRLLFDSLPLLAISILFNVLSIPTFKSIVTALIFVSLSHIILSCIGFIIGMATIRTGGVSAIIHLKDFVYSIAAGVLLPISFYPGFIKTLFELLPFRFAVGVPVEMLVGVYDYSVLYRDVIILLFWTILLYVTACIVEKFSLRKLSVYMG